jgi:hypothetical protein
MWMLSSDADVTQRSPVSSNESELIGFALSLKTFAGLNVEMRDRDRAKGCCAPSSNCVCITLTQSIAKASRSHRFLSAAIQNQQHTKKKNLLQSCQLKHPPPKSSLSLLIITRNGSHWCKSTYPRHLVNAYITHPTSHHVWLFRKSTLTLKTPELLRP